MLEALRFAASCREHTQREAARVLKKIQYTSSVRTMWRENDVASRVSENTGTNEKLQQSEATQNGLSCFHRTRRPDKKSDRLSSLAVLTGFGVLRTGLQLSR